MQVAAARIDLAVVLSRMLATPAFARAMTDLTHIEGGGMGGGAAAGLPR